MSKLSMFQFVSLDDGRVAIRCYNLETDRFERVAVCGPNEYEAVDNKYLFVEKEALVFHDNKLYSLGQGELVLQDPDSADRLWKFDARTLNLPFNYLLKAEEGRECKKVKEVTAIEKEGATKLLYAAGKEVGCFFFEEYQIEEDRGDYVEIERRASLKLRIA